MAAARHPIYLLLLLAHLPQGSRAQDRRFSELKRCADPECSMLMVRGKALKDFTGPDCRFVNFKKDESIYVYHKLDGRTTDLWAGTVGTTFGYFPKELLDVKQVYMNDEIELPADETDFVCFDGGTDNFDNYNVDELLNKPKASTAGPESSEEKAQPEDRPSEDRPSEEKEASLQSQAGETKSDQKDRDQAEREDESEKDGDLVKDKPEESSVGHSGKEESVEEASVDTLNVNSQSERTQEDKVALEPEVPETAKNDSISQGESTGSDEKSKTLEAYTLLEENMLQGLKTHIGSSDDAVVTDDEETRQNQT
ncbi:transport and Golgi organization protein 1 homolog [Spea bombifrons]|uniref:transport and Golgi organization protein 1 homolog n=1 Tax=Spea bombifrons TaxID=233779 RepID=UPI00234A049F|nr:transport and Golgi organization protein 1 homolog [Spea bombifrons]